MKRRILMTLVGVVLCGICCGILKMAAFGVDPFTVVVTGLDAYLPIEYGMLYIVLNAVLLIFSFVFDRHYIGLGTILNLFFIGYITQYTYAFLQYLFPTGPVMVRVICLVCGMILSCLAGSLYMTADLGVSTYDAISLVMAHKWHLGPFKYMRIITDVCCVILGSLFYLLAGNPFTKLFGIVNVGTIILAFCMGPLIEFFNHKVSNPLLNR